MKTTTKWIIGGIGGAFLLATALFLTRKKWLPLFVKEAEAEEDMPKEVGKKPLVAPGQVGKKPPEFPGQVGRKPPKARMKDLPLITKAEMKRRSTPLMTKAEMKDLPLMTKEQMKRRM